MRYVKYTIKDLLNIKEEDFLSALFLHTENRMLDEQTSDEKDKIDSWRDCLSFFKKYMSNYPNISSISQAHVCFEYKIFDGTWIDAIIVCHNKLIILEFKSGSDTRYDTLVGHRAQVFGYYNKITRCNRIIWEEMKRNPEFHVEKYLIYTNPAMKGNTEKLDYIKVCDDFEDVLSKITEAASDKRVEELLEFVEELDITTTGVMRDILNKKVLSKMYVEDDNVTACADIIDDIQKKSVDRSLNLIFIKGEPGAGKTGTAFSLLEKYINKGAKYVTGNGNLSAIFRQLIREDNIDGAEAAAVGSLHDLYEVNDFCAKHKDNCSVDLKKIDNKLLIIDEAQRVWNPIQIAIAKKNKLSDDHKAFIIENEVSEAMLVLRGMFSAVHKDNNSRTIVFLLGSGQEIYLGEEDGEKYIKKAISHLRDIQLQNPIDINIYVPTTEMEIEYKSLGHFCKKEDGLLLDGDKRNVNSKNEINSKNANSFIQSVIEDASPEVVSDLKDVYYVFNDFSELKSSLKSSFLGAFSIGIVANGFDTLTRWEMGRYGKNVPVSYLILDGLEIHNISNSELKSFYIDRKGNELDKFASQFNCQGLELDYTIVIWGSKMLRRGNEWIISKEDVGTIDNYCKQVDILKQKYPQLTTVLTVNKDQIRDTFIKNCYRVLLTRSRISTRIFVEDRETFDYLKRIIEV
ncbi:DUF2075 domain-containing protein [Clostridium folliculivorans]|uniref:DUF2075 domain-containing protein n=1 Tax=Clostridium folliculivorans TaxID=2886038 RepID=UPI0021C2FB66|nr:DUF2075 domain-containing protein [Clostridium folliculivorans]GKU31434.1 hypothetical protein CFB3_35410 [Clostridium folliculivorans]